MACTELAIGAEAPGQAWQMLTVVHPDHRGHRLGLAIKLANLDALARQAPERPVSSSPGMPSVNAPMIAVNDMMGFEVAGGGQFLAETPAACPYACRPPGGRSDAIDAFGVLGEELGAGRLVEAGRELAERRVQLVEGAVDGVNGEVAGEEAAFDAEGPEGVLEPRAQGVDSPWNRTAWPGRTTCRRR